MSKQRAKNKNQKQQLRVKLLAKRRELPQAEIVSRSKEMAQQLYAWPYYQQAKVIMLFLSMPDEPQMDEILKDAWQQGKTVCVPHMRSEFGIMDAAIIENHQELVKGRFNLLVPDPTQLTLIDPCLIDVILVPAVAYDCAGNRLGMGAGYYDRFIPQALQAVRIGAIWTTQMIDQVPCDPYDKPVHYLLREDGIVPCDTGQE